MFIMEERGSSETSVRTTRRHDPDDSRIQSILSQWQSAFRIFNVHFIRISPHFLRIYLVQYDPALHPGVVIFAFA